MPILFERQYERLGHVYVCDGGALGTFTLPDDSTDRVASAAAAAPLDAAVLGDLAAVVKALKGS